MKQKPQDTLPGALALAVKQLKNLIVLNLLCILHALLIITAGRSLSALVRCCMRLVNGEVIAPVRAFREEFKKKDSIKACWLFLLALAIAGLESPFAPGVVEKVGRMAMEFLEKNG